MDSTVSKSPVKLIAMTSPMDGKSAEEFIAYVARVSNPANQDNLETVPRLIKYLIKNSHWSPFELCTFTVEIETSRAIAAQILRHRSFSFQELSQRYATGVDAIAPEVIKYPARRQDIKNRQNSIDDMLQADKDWFESAQHEVETRALSLYDDAITRGIAKEQARFLLPLSTKTRIYMSGSVRSWIHYIQLRTEAGTQKEHRDIAEAIKVIFSEYYPAVAEALEWQ